MNWCILLLFLFQAGDSGAWLLVTAKATPFSEISKRELRQIYLQKLDRVGGTRVTPIHLSPEDPLRKTFEAWLFPPDFDLEGYWLLQRLQGGERVPFAAANQAYVLVYVERNPGFIGYVSADRRGELSQFDVKILGVVDR